MEINISVPFCTRIDTLDLESIDVELPEEDRQSEMIKKAVKFIKEFCIPEVPESDIETNGFERSLCGWQYICKVNLLRHLKQEGHDDPKSLT